MKSEKQLERFFESGIIEFMIEENIAIVKGEITEMKTTDMVVRNKMWELVEVMLKKANDTIEVRAGTYKDIARALKRGKITVQEAKDLTSIIQSTEGPGISANTVKALIINA